MVARVNVGAGTTPPPDPAARRPGHRRAAHPPRRTPPPLTGRLTPRERESLAHLGASPSNTGIAGQLRLLEGTVKAHVSAVLPTLGARHRVEAAISAYEAGLVPARRADLGVAQWPGGPVARHPDGPVSQRHGGSAPRRLAVPCGGGGGAGGTRGSIVP